MSESMALPASVFASPGAQVEHLIFIGWPGRAIERLRREARRMRDGLRRFRQHAHLDREERIRRHREGAAALARHASALRSAMLARPIV